MRRALLVAALVLATAVPVAAQRLPQAPGCPVFPADSFWHADVSRLPVHARSATYVTSIGRTAGLKADFGSGQWDGGPIGIPYTTVSGTQPKVAVSFEYAGESDRGPYPIPANAPIEGGPNSNGDRHVLVVDRDNCKLYELYAAYRQPNGSWRAGSGAIYDMRSNALRPAGWTSADAAGLAILPGLVRYDEVAAGVIDHAIRITVPHSEHRYVWPARHRAGEVNAALPPMGMRFRLKAGFGISGFPAHAQTILRALKKYGGIVADNGSPWYMSGAPDSRWNNDVLHTLGQVPGSAFEAVESTSLMKHPDSGAVKTAKPAAPSALSLASTSYTTDYAQRITLTGRLDRASATTAIPGERVELWRRRKGTTPWTYVAAATSSATGAVAFAQAPGNSTEFQLRHPASLDWGTSTSPTRLVSVRPIITISRSATTLTGTVSPNHAGQPVYLAENHGAGWAFTTGYVLSATSGYRFTVQPTARGTHYYRVYRPADADNLAAYSPSVAVTVG